MKHCRPYKRNINLEIHHITMYSRIPGWNLGVWPAVIGCRQTTKYTPRVTGSQRLLTCILLDWLHGFGFTLLSSLIFQTFFLFALLTTNQQKKRKKKLLLTGFTHKLAPLSRPHHRSSSPIRPEALSASQRAVFELLRPSSSFIDKPS